MIQVVSGIVIKDNRILMTQRLTRNTFDRRWETPGGKVKDNEDYETALNREFREEIGGQYNMAIVNHYKFDVNFDDILIVKFFSVWFQGSIHSKEGKGLGWFTLEEADALMKTSAIYLAWPNIRKLMQS